MPPHPICWPGDITLMQSLGLDINLLTLKADNGDVPAMVNLAMAYELGASCKKDAAKAYWYYQQALKSGHKLSLVNIAIFHILGIACDQNRDMAIDELKMALAEGYHESAEILAKLYDEGLDCDRSLPNAIRYWRLAAVESPWACAHLARYYKSRKNNFEEPRFSLLFQNSVADLGSFDEIMSVVHRNVKNDYYPAMNALGRVYEEGLFGQMIDIDQARYWYEKADESMKSGAFWNVMRNRYL